MSFSRGFKGSSNPCQAWLGLGRPILGQDEKGEDVKGPAEFQRWDKESKSNITCDLTGGFIIMDYQMMKVSGYNKKYKKNVMSNEVRTVNDPLKVICYLPDGSKQVLAEGSYNQIKDKLQGIGGKYTTSLYIAINPTAVGVESNDLLILANLECNGAMLQGWMEYSQKVRASVFSSHYVKHTGAWVDRVNGDVKYKSPIFATGDEIGKEAASLAFDLDITLQEYLAEYLNKGAAADHITDPNQESSGHEDQSVPDEDEVPEFLRFKLKDGRQLRDLDDDELKSKLQVLEEMKASPTNVAMVAIKATIAYRKPPKKSNPFQQKVVDETPIEDDDIPF